MKNQKSKKSKNRRFIFILILSGLMTFISLNLYTFHTTTVCEDSYVASYQDKMKQLENTSAPRLILVGDSNLTFTIDSELLDATFNYSPLNMAISDQIGLRYNLESIRPYIQKGDIVLVSSHYDQLIEGQTLFDSQGTSMLLSLLIMRPQDIRFITSLQQAKNLTLHNVHLMFERLSTAKNDCIRTTGKFFSRDKFNTYGDYIGHLTEESVGKDFNHINLATAEIDPDVIAYLNGYAEFVEQNGAQFLFSYSAYSEDTWNNSEQKLIEFHQQAISQFKFPVIGHPENYYLPNTMLFDTQYHGTAEGRLRRTQQLIIDLQNYFGTLQREQSSILVN